MKSKPPLLNQISLRTLLATALPLILLSSCSDHAHSAIVGTFKKGSETPGKPSDPGIIELTVPEEHEINLTTKKAELRTLPREVVLTGLVEPDTTITTPVISLVGGRVEEVLVAQGDSVKVGQKLAHLRSDDIAKIEADLLRDVLDFDADIEQAQVQLELTKKIYDRHSQLVSEGISARADFDEALSNLQKAQAEVRMLKEKRQALITTASERLRLYGVDMASLRKVLLKNQIDDTFDIVSPRNGIVTERVADVGQLIDNVNPLFVITDLSRVWMTAQAFEKDIQSILKGQEVQVYVHSFPGKCLQGRIDWIGSVLNAETHTLPVRITIQNPNHLLKPKMFVTVKITVGKDQAIAIPYEAVQKTGETYLAYVETGPGRFQERKITLGRKSGSTVEILSGLRPGEVVAVHGSLQLQGQMLKKLSQ